MLSHRSPTTTLALIKRVVPADAVGGGGVVDTLEELGEVGVWKRGAGTTANGHDHTDVDGVRTQSRVHGNRQRRAEDRCRRNHTRLNA